MQAQTEIPLYDGEIPNARPSLDLESKWWERDSIEIISRVSRPTLSIYLPVKGLATGAAVIICPGGGYTNLAVSHEGADVAKRFADSGIAAFVLKYRIPDDNTMINKEIGPLQDAQRAILIVRSRASEWGIDSHRIGIMGFSAGGHLASTTGTHFKKNYIVNPGHISLRPDFMLLIYPVISFDSSIAHLGSMHNLIGAHPSALKIKEYSNERQITDETPPAFLVHAKDDNVVPFANSLRFEEALMKNKIPAELFVYDLGGHGFGMNNKASSADWMKRCIQWVLELKPGSD